MKYIKQIKPIIIWFHFYVEHKEQCRGQYGKGGKNEGEEIREGDKPYETLDSGKQIECCGKGGGLGGNWVMGSKEDT